MITAATTVKQRAIDNAARLFDSPIAPQLLAIENL
jgi:hypothetical protein